MNSATHRWCRVLVAFCLASLALGCRSAATSDSSEDASTAVPAEPSTAPDDSSSTTSTNVELIPGAISVDSVTVDAGAEAGPSCTGSGDPTTTGMDGGSTCTGGLAAQAFPWALCSCSTIKVTGGLTTDAFNDTLGGPDGGAGGSVGANSDVSTTAQEAIGGTLWTPGNVSVSATSVVRGDLHIGGTLGTTVPFTVDGNAYSVKSLPSNAHVLGTVTHPSSVPAACDCTDTVQTAAIIAAHRAPNNDDATIGLSPTIVAAPGGTVSRIDLPCGNYYLSQVNASASLVIAVHGHTALYVDGNLNSTATLTFQLDPTATLDLFVSGSFTVSGVLTMGSPSAPAHCRAYLGTKTLSLSASSVIGCNIYAPAAAVTTTAAATLSGSIFADSYVSNGATTIHYDTSIQGSGGECCTAAKCDDGNPCTVDACNSDGTCSHTSATNGTACSDGNACTQTDTCQAGVCTGSNPVTCTASDACHTAGTCNTSTGTCSNPVAANGTSCSDGNACTKTDTCQAGVCTGSNPVTCTASDACHTAGTCNPANGMCSNPVATNGTSCSDGNACTKTDTCQAGVCTGSNPVTCAASDACHTAGTCNTSTGQCSNPVATNGTSCSDGNACTQTDSCQNGTCTGSNPVTCTASDACHTAGTCNTSTGQCSNPVATNGTSCSDGNACTQTDTCQAGVCTGSNPVTCTASDACHTAGTCNTSTGQCSNPVATNGTSCSDGNACTQTDTCQAGMCTGSNPMTCAASDACHTAGTCNTSTGQCSNPVATNGTSCSDGNACTQTDSCQNGTCTGSNPVTCTASDACHTAGTCNPANGTCSNPVASNGTSCSDGNACTQADTCQAGVCTGSNPVTCAASDACHTAGTCNTSTGQCSNPVATNGTSCSDGNACTQADTCQAGVCTGSNPVTCTASDACHTAGTCNTSTGQCSNPVATNGTSCSDGNACTQTDSCQNGTCTGSNPVTCTASDACHTAGTCNPANGTCSNPVASNGTSCSDGNACTQNDSCQSGVCVGGSAVTCAADQCHAAGTCDPTKGCTSAPAADGTPCTGTNLCNQVYACQAGVCSGSNPVTCTASDACHVAGTCNPTTGACSNAPAPNGTSCSDGNACTQSDSCQSGVCTGSDPVACAASDACHTAGSCNPATGVCSNPSAADGTSCGSGDASPGMVCTSGACGAPPVCTSVQTMCHGTCANTQSDADNCGSCGNACSGGGSCVAGTCLTRPVMASCGMPSGSMSVLVSSDGVTAYVPNGSWTGNATGVQRLVLEGGTAWTQTIPTPNAVNSCASNWVTGETVCVSNGTDVYLIKGTTITATLQSGATGLTLFSGGECYNCGVAIDASTNKAILEIGLAVEGSANASGYQFLDLSSNVFGAPIPVAVDPTQVPGQQQRVSEDVAVDSVRHMVLSPNEPGDYQILQYGAAPTSFNNTFPALPPNSGPPFFDSAAEDCTTGIALATDEFNASITLVDLNQAAFTPGSPYGTWAAAFSDTPLPNLPFGPNGNSYEMTGLAVAPGSHLAIIGGEDLQSGTFVVVKLPAAAGTGTPTPVDWAAGVISYDPTGSVWLAGLDPHSVTAYVSPNSGRAIGLMANAAGGGQAPPSFVAQIDLQAVLDAPRLPGTHNLDPTYDVVAHGALTFIDVPCSAANINADPRNCGSCGNACPQEVNSQPTCVNGACALACDAGFVDCNNDPSDGCEANLLIDPSNCGGCHSSCAVPNATATCNGGQCGAVCNAGFSDCDGDLSNGCEVQGPCVVPSGSVVGPTSVAVGDTPTYTATVSDAVPGRTLTYAWTALSGPGTVTFSAPSALVTTAAFPLPGTYVVEFEVNDGFATASASLTVTAAYVNRPPVVAVGTDQTLTAPTLSTTLSGTATDDGLPQGATLSGTWSLASGPVAVAIASPTTSGVAEPGPLASSTTVTFSYPGTYVFELDVSDMNLVGSATTTVTINAPAAPGGGGGGGGGGSAPTVAIGGVTDDQEVTNPTPILGTVSDGSWVLEQRLGGRDDVQTAWTVMASGTGAENGASLATFDPTLLLNGIYTVRLSATNSAGSTSTTVSLSVDGRMKVGNFTLAFTDLNVAVAGYPFTLTRVYDSRDKTVGDFGVGWKLGITDVRVEKSGKTGAYWQQQFTDEGFFGEYCLVPSQATSVAITFPGGRQYRFVPQSSPQCQAETELTDPDIVWVSTSDPNNPTITLNAVGGTSVFANDVGNGVTQLQTDEGDIWDPRQFTLTIEDGTVYQIDEDQGVTEITDAAGNSLTVTPQGIVHSSGAQVTFARDDQGRITTITDPAGNAMTYAYDDDGDLASYTDRLSNTTQFGYGANHYLDTIQDPLGRQPIRNDYDANGRLLSTTDASGNVVHYTPNLAANQEQVTDRLGHVTVYTYNDRGDVTQKVDATGAVWNYTFDIRGNVLSTTDPLGHVTSTTYDGADNALTQTDALGNVTTNTYDSLKAVVTTTDPLGHVTTNNWGGVNLQSQTDALGNATTYTYDVYGRWAGSPITETDALGNVTTNVYDDAGHLTQRTDGLGRTTSSTYDANGNKTSETAARSNFNGSGAIVTTTYTYDAVGHLLQTQKSVASSPRSTTYTATGKRATTTDEDGRVTSYAYDALDRLVTTTHPDGTTETQTYDAENHRTSSTDAAGNTTTYAYDAVGRLIRTTYADGSSTSTAYDSAGRAIETIDELGHVQWTSYDAAGRRTSTTDAVGSVAQHAYDAAGNEVSTTDPLGHVTRIAYDADNRQVATTYADASADSTLYDRGGRMIAKNDTLGRSTDYGYDADGELVKVTDALGNVTLYTYDETGTRTSQVDANKHTTSFAYDFATNVEIGRTLPDGSSESRTDDAVGQVLSRTDFAGQTTQYTYDPTGRILTRTYPDNSVVSFTYTPDGRRATATDARGVTTYAYDSRRRVAQMTTPDGRALSYGYDAHGDRTSLTAKIGSQSLTTTTGYDADEHPSSVKDPLGRVTAVTYDAAGNRAGMTYPNATGTSYSYDVRDRLTHETTTQSGSSPVTIQSYGYTLDLAGRRTAVAEADGTLRSYGYDAIDRLTSETVTGSLAYAKTFAYDAVGNRLTQTTTGAGAATVNYGYDVRDRLTTENATEYGYDANGNVTSKSGEATYAWDFENRLTSVGVTGAATVAHVYDADGNRVKTSVTPSGGSAATTNMLVDAAGGLSQVIAETDGSGNLSAYYVRVGDELLEVMRPATGGTWNTKFIHGDGLGSVRALTDETGTTVDTRGYEAFGTKNAEAGNDPLTYGFAGEPFEGTAKLAYHRARWMDARVGRFEGMDPFKGYIRDPQSLHRYAYCRSNPVNRLDQSGKQDDIEDVTAAVDIVGIEATTAEATVAHPAAIAAEVAAENAVAVTETAIEEATIQAETVATETVAETTADQTIAQGLAQGGKLGRVLLAIQEQFALNPPSTALEASAVIARAAAAVGLDTGYATIGAGGIIVIANKGGVTTTLLTDGSVLVEKAGQVLLRLP